MGNAFNNPLDEAKQARMQEIIGDVLTLFATEFPIHYKDALIEKVKAEAQPEEEDERQLPDFPIPDYELKTGSLTKKGDVVKNWKARHFVALNKADNYRVDYYEKEGGKLKGSINFAGYSVADFDENETKELGQFGIKIVPSDTRRRVWYLKASSEEDKAEWVKVFKNACDNASAPQNPDEVLSAAFNGAYRAVRWRYGYYGWYRINYTEAEQLGELVSNILYRELISDVIYNIPAGPARGSIVNMVQKSVDTTVMAAVGAAWNSGVQACTSLRSTLEGAAKSLLTPLFEQEVKLKQEIQKVTNSTVVPVLQDLGSRICQPLMRICSNPITAAYVAGIRGFLQYMQTNVIPELTGDNLASQIRRVHMSVEYWWSGPMENANKICWNLYCSDLADVASYFSGGYSTYSLYSKVLNSIRDLMHRAIFAFETRYTDGFTNFGDNLTEVLSRLIHDSILSLKELLNSILGGILQDPIESGIINPCMSLVKPIQDVIDSIPVPGLSDLFNLSSLTDDVLNTFVETSLGAIVDGSFGQIESQIDATRRELNVPKK